MVHGARELHAEGVLDLHRQRQRGAQPQDFLLAHRLLCRTANRHARAFGFGAAFAVGRHDVTAQQVAQVGSFRRVGAARGGGDADAVAQPLICERRRRLTLPDAAHACQFFPHGRGA